LPPHSNTSRARLRVVLNTPTWVRPLQVAVAFEPFRNFSSGSGEIEVKVNKLIAERFEGQGQPAQWCVMETGSASTKVAGVCAYLRRDLTFDLLPTPMPTGQGSNATITLAGAAYVHVIALSEEFRGKVLPDGTRLGSALLRGTQHYIKCGWNGLMPWTWAYVEQANLSSHRLFYREGFGWIPPQTPGEDYRHLWSPTNQFRDPNVQPPWECDGRRDMAA
jgi:hypothetical protein